MLTRREFVSSAAALAAENFSKRTLAQSTKSDHVTEKPNILIFMPDQQQGQTVLPENPCLTPNLDKFTSESILFPNAFCPTPHCCPSRASFQTGQYPSEHGIFNNVSNQEAIHPDPYPGTPFFSSSLRSAGYNLSYSGKWHVARNVQPEDVGWKNLTPDLHYISGAQRDPKKWVKPRVELNSPSPREKGEVIRPGWGNTQLYGSFPPRGPKGYEGLSDAEIVRLGAEEIGSIAKDRKPWCLMVSNSGGHDPYMAPQNFVDKYKADDVVLPPSFRDMMDDKPRIYQRMRYQYWSQLSDQEVKQSIAHYWAKLSMQDALFGELLDALNKSGQADNTIVVYVSDHGDYAGAHGIWAKGIPSFREAYNIPCVIRWPRGMRKPGRRVDAFVSTADFAPTFLDAAGIASSGNQMSGSSLLPWLRDEKPTGWRDAIFSQMNGVELYYTQRIVMTDSYKYVYNGFDYDELYDLKNDPHETVNLAFPDLKANRERVQRGNGSRMNANAPWPLLPGGLEEVRREMLKKMWDFAREHKDQLFDSYLTTAMAPIGPALAF